MNWIVIAGLNGFLAIVLGAFGAHALSERLGEASMVTYQTGSQYHLIHAVVLLGLSLAHYPKRLFRRSLRLILAGEVLFCASLYVYSIYSIKLLVFITPIGGLTLLAGWIYIAFEGQKYYLKRNKID